MTKRLLVGQKTVHIRAKGSRSRLARRIAPNSGCPQAKQLPSLSSDRVKPIADAISNRAWSFGGRLWRKVAVQIEKDGTDAFQVKSALGHAPPFIPVLPNFHVHCSAGTTSLVGFGQSVRAPAAPPGTTVLGRLENQLSCTCSSSRARIRPGASVVHAGAWLPS